MNGTDTFAQQAVALFYDSKSAPRVTAKGSGSLAEQIIALALEHDVPLQENPELVALLSLLELGEEIPHDLYVTVAQLIAFAYMLKGKVPEQPQTVS
jgi:flagellar biosynthesis protein